MLLLSWQIGLINWQPQQKTRQGFKWIDLDADTISSKCYDDVQDVQEFINGWLNGEFGVISWFESNPKKRRS